LGYSDMLYFSRTFRKACGMSPSSYRKLIETKY
ncbi:MAG TPA: DNA-binding transcriptional regulator AraC, partial [Treponema sp.]|nr:DNA-binding transcriptional regulator AraC [Treponema sp.]